MYRRLRIGRDGMRDPQQTMTAKDHLRRSLDLNLFETVELNCTSDIFFRFNFYVRFALENRHAAKRLYTVAIALQVHGSHAFYREGLRHPISIDPLEFSEIGLPWQMLLRHSHLHHKRLLWHGTL